MQFSPIVHVDHVSSSIVPSHNICGLISHVLKRYKDLPVCISGLDVLIRRLSQCLTTGLAFLLVELASEGAFSLRGLRSFLRESIILELQRNSYPNDKGIFMVIGVLPQQP